MALNYDQKQGLGSIAGGLAGLFGGGQSPGDAAMPYLDQARQQLPGYYQPYIDAGMGQLPGLNSNYSKLTNDPGALMNQFGKSFQQSPGMKFSVDQAITSGNRAAAGAGMLGTPSSMQDISSHVQGLAQQDYNNWMANALGLYGQGLHGMEGLYDTGFNASANLGNNMTSLSNAQANMAYQNQAAQNKSQGAGIGGIVSGIGGLLGLF